MTFSKGKLGTGKLGTGKLGTVGGVEKPQSVVNLFHYCHQNDLYMSLRGDRKSKTTTFVSFWTFSTPPQSPINL